LWSSVEPDQEKRDEGIKEKEEVRERRVAQLGHGPTAWT